MQSFPSIQNPFPAGSTGAPNATSVGHKVPAGQRQSISGGSQNETLTQKFTDAPAIEGQKSQLPHSFETILNNKNALNTQAGKTAVTDDSGIGIPMLDLPTVELPIAENPELVSQDSSPTNVEQLVLLPFVRPQVADQTNSETGFIDLDPAGLELPTSHGFQTEVETIVAPDFSSVQLNPVSSEALVEEAPVQTANPVESSVSAVELDADVVLYRRPDTSVDSLSPPTNPKEVDSPSPATVSKEADSQPVPTIFNIEPAKETSEVELPKLAPGVNPPESAKLIPEPESLVEVRSFIPPVADKADADKAEAVKADAAADAIEPAAVKPDAIEPEAVKITRRQTTQPALIQPAQIDEEASSEDEPTLTSRINEDSSSNAKQIGFNHDSGKNSWQVQTLESTGMGAGVTDTLTPITAHQAESFAEISTASQNSQAGMADVGASSIDNSVSSKRATANVVGNPFGADGRIVSKQVLEPLAQEVSRSKEGERIMTLHLHPAELGKLTVKVGWDSETISAKIVTSELATSELLNRDRNWLVNHLQASGLDVTSFDVSHGGSDFEREFDQSSNRDSPSPFRRQAESTETGSTPTPTGYSIDGKGSVINIVA